MNRLRGEAAGEGGATMVFRARGTVLSLCFQRDVTRTVARRARESSNLRIRSG